MESMLIVRPKLQTLKQRYANAALTLFFWAIWFYLWIPLISLLAWLFGIETFYEEIVLMEGYRILLKLIFWYSLIVLILSMLLLSWARYNQFRFRGKDRRKNTPTPTIEDLANFFEIDSELLSKYQKTKRATIWHTKKGRIDKIDL